ncbi:MULTISPECIES: hypothetical protein [Carboxydocella]|uniref:2-phosphosulfolactate phosphatase n=2 Tax=Carboxydocella TaxID=178898 RepID=A0A1T4NJZ0_9FIRM|nr:MULTISPECIES: hypothetical protein [Carboxydocella]AVX20073.1 hypothetical protein CFE_0875 [Carboxydocella thermautotrophica]AVX30490.1 hypothetical protein CTH_0890 [Carboxydocella thermautotrophica]SJZ79453.1 hypothetical protein SAMN02745885_00937 [Carboxydocella sporoproducens DSM 16521]GAW27851.1 hypothetical protein ULO1_04210 [Carboxydocella sp. ULO1]GAW32672.1 hypothetical protein JDF658_24370 [Carboxydocella sp. JDF658]
MGESCKVSHPVPLVTVTVNASGAAAAARQGLVVVIVDVIDMSTTAEGLLEAGAAAVIGASPDQTRAPVAVQPRQRGMEAGQKARELGTGVILVSEPRYGQEEERRARCQKALAGLAETGLTPELVLPNLGAETAKMADFAGKVILLVSDTGGVAYDAAVTAGAPAVLTATIARTIGRRGTEPARLGAERARLKARELGTGVAVVAASGNSLEDVLAAEYIGRLLLESP